MKKNQAAGNKIKKKIPFLYRSFFNFWLAVVLPATIVALVVSKLYYNNTINLEPLKEPATWLYFGMLQIFATFFIYLWVYRQKAKKYRE